MRECVAVIESASQYSQSKPIDTPRGERETHKDHEERIWRERIHADAEGNVFIPPMAFKNALSEAAKFLSLQIPGKGKATYTKHFEAGVLAMEAVPLGIKRDEVPGEWLFVPSEGVRGGGKRVWKCFPLINQWKGTVRFMILDDTITDAVFEKHLKEAGNFIGIGRFRPRNNGYYGRFRVVSTKWSDKG